MWRWTSLTVIGALAGAFGVLLVAPVEAELVLAVDFGTQDRAPDDTGFSPNRVQPGFQDFSLGPEESGANGDGITISPPVPSVSRTYGDLQVTIADSTPGSNGLFFADYGTVDHLLGPIAEGVIASSGDLTLRIDGLSSGSYRMTTYHHYVVLTQQRFIGEIVAISNATSTTVATHVPVSVGFSPLEVSSSTFRFVADGTGSAQFVFKHEPPLGVPILNGFSVTRVPEPTGAVLTGAGLLLVPIRKRRN